MTLNPITLIHMTLIHREPNIQPNRISQAGERRHYLWLLLVYLIAFPLLFKPTLHGSDPLGYYAWVRSVVLDGDLDVDNEFKQLGFDQYQNVTTETGYRYNHWPAGPALLWSPLYALVHGALILFPGLQQSWPADGYSPPYQIAVSIASTLYAFIGLLCLYDIARRITAATPAFWATIALWFASPLLFYMYSSPIMSHAVDFFTAALFIWVWYRTRAGITWRGWFARGITIGLAVIVRPQNGLLILFPALELLWMLRTQGGKLIDRTRHMVGMGIAFGGGLAMLLVPQMIFWRVVYGHWVYNTYTITYTLEGTTLELTHPHLWELAVSNNHGLFVWSPILLFGLVGMGLLFQRDARLAALLWFSLLLQFYLVSSLSTWHGGGPSFGARYLIGSLPAFLLGLAMLFALVQPYTSARWIAVFCGLFVLWNLLLIVQYTLETIPRSGPMDIGQMVAGQFRVIPDNLQRILRVLQTRGPD